MKKLNNKNFNADAFSKYTSTIEEHKKNKLIRAMVLKPNSEIKRAFNSYGNMGYAILPMYGKIDGDVLNYDGKTDIVANTTKTFERGVVVVGRANAWLEDDFMEDSSSRYGFMSGVARQVREYFDDVDQSTIISILKGVFSMTGAKNLEFINAHTNNITKEANTKIDVTTLNSTIQKACGDNKSKFSAIIMHSIIATNLENINILNYLKYTDENGVQKDISLATLNGRIVIIDDSLPIQNDNGENIYTTYILGNGAIDFEDIGTKMPYEINRDPKTNGGQDTFYARSRKCFAPFGISYTKKAQASMSPTNAELENGVNWTLAIDNTTKETIEHKYIPIARIISKG